MKVVTSLSSLIIALSLTFGSGQALEVMNPFRDIITYYQGPTIPDLMAIIWNKLWSFFAPWVGGYTMVLAYDAYQMNPGLYSFLGYTVHDFYVIGMQQQKYNFANTMGYESARNANYTDSVPEPPPE